MSSTDRRTFLRSVGAGALGATVYALDGAAQPRAGRQKRPNLLLLMTDQHRSDCLGCAGNSIIRTPNLDRIAANGVRFRRAYTSTPSCTPARSALLTGLAPWHHGMLGYGRVAEHYPVEMPRALRDAGYWTFGIGKMHWFPQRTLHGFHGTLLDESGRAESPGFVSDYRRWFKSQAPDKDPDATGIDWNDYRARVYQLPEELHPTMWMGNEATAFIEAYDKPEPFYLKVSFARPHSPYDPPQRFWNLYRTEDMPAPVVGDWAARHAEHADPPPPGLAQGDLGVKTAQEARHGYYASVTFIDEQIGRILDALARNGLDKNTLILFIADHGDMLGDHHLWRKTYPYESSAGIPMLLQWPEGYPAAVERGSVLEQPVEIRDVFPTFMDAAGQPIPEGIDGRSLLGLVRGETDWRPYLDLEHATCYFEWNNWNALTDGRWKYVWFAPEGREQLFDLDADPHELRNLAEDPAHAAMLATWRERMVAHFAERGPEFVQDGKLVAGRKKILYSPLFPEA